MTGIELIVPLRTYPLVYEAYPSIYEGGAHNDTIGGWYSVIDATISQNNVTTPATVTLTGWLPLDSDERSGASDIPVVRSEAPIVPKKSVAERVVTLARATIEEVCPPKALSSGPESRVAVIPRGPSLFCEAEKMCHPTDAGIHQDALLQLDGMCPREETPATPVNNEQNAPTPSETWSSLMWGLLQRGVATLTTDEKAQKIALLFLLFLGGGLLVDRSHVQRVVMDEPRRRRAVRISLPDDDGLTTWTVSSRR